MISEGLIVLRQALARDAVDVRELVRSAYAKWVSVIGREPLPMQADYERAIAEHQIDLLSVDGTVVGLIEMIPRPDHLWIENVAVSPESQRQGIGRRLLSHAENKAASAGLDELRLLTNAAFEANVALYESVGYEIDRLEPFMGGTTVYMRKHCF